MTEKCFDGSVRHTSCTTGGPVFYWTKDGKVTRVAPMTYTREEYDPWVVEKNGHVYKPPITHPLMPWALTKKQATYSEDRVRYPLKRIDWDPEGDRNACNRGISGYERISWDEALSILVSEIRRISEQYGPASMAFCNSGHPVWGSTHYHFSDEYRFCHMLGATYMQYTPVSWEAWSCGAPLVWGSWKTYGLPPAPNSLQDVTKHSETIICWSSNPVFRSVYVGLDSPRALKFWKDLGKTIIVIDSNNSDTANAFATKWIPIIPGTDGALACAIAYIWITEGTYDKDYLDTHVLGFDGDHLPDGIAADQSFEAYILGEWEDGQPKTPQWAEEKCGVPAQTIIDLAHLWASAPTALFGMLGGYCRREYADTTIRLVSALQIMQGLGKPGVCMLAGDKSLAGPYDINQVVPAGYADGGMNLVLKNYPFNSDRRQAIQYLLLEQSFDNPPQRWFGGKTGTRTADEYFQVWEYPHDGKTEMHFLWIRGSTIVCEPNVTRQYTQYKRDQIETLVISAPWFDRSCHYADLVLPIAINFEREDLTEPSSIGRYTPPAMIMLRSMVFHQKGIEPVGESRTDMEIYDEVSKMLGYGDIYMEGQTVEDMLKVVYAETKVEMTYEEFKERGYLVWPKPDTDNYDDTKQFQKFYEDPVANPIDTPTGKMELFSTIVYDHYGFNNEIPAIPHYIPEKEGSENAELREKYPLQINMCHPKFRFHGKFNNLPWLQENYKVYGDDGYPYEPLTMHKDDARRRGLKDGDIVRAFNDRGEVLAGLKVTEMIREGTVWLTYGSWHDPINPVTEHGHYLDRGGDGNNLTQSGPMSPHHATGGAFNSVLLEVEKADLPGLRAKYPDGFAGKFSSWNWRAE